MKQLLFMCLMCIPCFAQPGRMYNPQTVETVSGTVESVETVSSFGGGIHITLKDNPLSIHLGPSWYLNEQGIDILQGDRVSVTGSRITLDGDQVLIAATVTKNGKSVTLRDAAGIPLWSRGRR